MTFTKQHDQKGPVSIESCPPSVFVKFCFSSFHFESAKLQIKRNFTQTVNDCFNLQHVNHFSENN